MTTEIDEDTDCSEWALENKVELPERAIPIKNLPDEAEYDGLFKGGSLMEEYENTVADMVALHEEWRDDTLEWSNRMDQLFAQIVVLERTLRDQGSAPPTDEFEGVTDKAIGIYILSAAGLIKSGVGLWSLLRGSSAAAPTGAVAPVNAGADARRVSTGVKAGKWAKRFQRTGNLLLGAGTVLSIGISVKDLIDRNKTLADFITNSHEWLYGKDEGGNLIAKPDVTTADITVGGAAGRILEMEAAVSDIHEAIRTLARLEGIAIEDADGKARDMNLVYCETKQALGDTVRSASQVMAAQDVATRMLCIDYHDDDITYSDEQIATVTGVPADVVQGMRGEVAAHPTDMCPGIAPGT
ncbi:hypothetical protein [Roseovarius sp. D22-M7]|uniref:hypothetical protein n=1 Tax=Roseovarius sp. D22-M7 TaxID=3127116 RepID=UPI0030104C11